MSTSVVFVHGLWLTGIESTLLRQRLGAELRCDTHYFHYPSVTATMEEILASLDAFVRALPDDTVHLVGHSLGGIVLFRYLESKSLAPPGRAVLLAAPLQGSRAAQRVARWPIGLAIMGRNIEAEVLPSAARRWESDRELGVIAGDLSLGVGKLLGLGDEPNDGTVLVAETDLPGATDRIVVPVSHTGMLFSAEVARYTAAFLRSGIFQSAG
jgi:pimeloyl-ACP methyl ester carboxylesterase